MLSLCKMYLRHRHNTLYKGITYTCKIIVTFCKRSFKMCVQKHILKEYHFKCLICTAIEHQCNGMLSNEDIFIAGGESFTKGSLTRDFLLQVFFYDSGSPRLLSIPSGPFQIRKYEYSRRHSHRKNSKWSQRNTYRPGAKEQMKKPEVENFMSRSL